MTISAAFFPNGRTLHIRAQSTRVDAQGEPAQQYLSAPMVGTSPA